MGQAKLRGTREQRVTAAIERETEAAALKATQRENTAKVLNAAYRSGIAKPGRPISALGAAMIGSALGSVMESTS